MFPETSGSGYTTATIDLSGGACPQFEAPETWWDAVSGFLAGVANR